MFLEITATSRWRFVMLAFACAALSLGLLISEKIYLAAVAGIIVGTLMFLNPTLGFYLTVATLPLEAAGKLGNILPFLQISLTKIFGLVTALCWVCHLLLRRTKFRWAPPATTLLTFLVLCGVSILGAEQWTNGYQAVIRLAGTFVFYILTINMVSSMAMLRRTLAILVVASSLTFAFAVVQRYIPALSFDMRNNMEDEEQQGYGVERQTLDPGTASYVERSSGTSQHSIIMSVNTAIILPCLVFFLLTSRSGWKPAVLAGIAATLGAAFFSFSRTGFLTVVITVCFLILVRVIRITPVLSVGALLAALIAVPLLPQASWERVFRPQSYTTEHSESLRIRMDLWSAGWRLWQDHPLTGMGVGNTRMLGRYWDDPNNGHYMTVHNAYLQTAMEAGLLALVALLIFFGQTLWGLETTSRRFRAFDYQHWVMSRAFQASLIALLFSGTALDFMNQSFKNGWFVMGCAVVLERESRRRTDTSAQEAIPSAAGELVYPVSPA